jgi:hypothetical protein
VSLQFCAIVAIMVAIGGRKAWRHAVLFLLAISTVQFVTLACEFIMCSFMLAGSGKSPFSSAMSAGTAGTVIGE